MSTLSGAEAYDCIRVLGSGSFGVVWEAKHIETCQTVAIKKVHQDPRYKNRELDVMKELNHCNVVYLKDYFYSEDLVLRQDDDGSEQKSIQRFLNVVMDYIPETVYRVMKSFFCKTQPLPMILVRLYTYQMCRALGYLHSLRICHRDVKPQNLLVNTRTHVLKLCDFGSAKRLASGEQSVSYICSRFYRAPELMLGATEYTTAIDLWSIGCVLGEFLTGRPVFTGESSVEQLVKIIEILGTPTREQMQAMSPNYLETPFPSVSAKDWSTVLTARAGFDIIIPPDALDLLRQFLIYEPQQRLTAYNALAHPFFDRLRQENSSLPDGKPFPPLFNFTEAELRCMNDKARSIVIPKWFKKAALAAAAEPKQMESADGGGLKFRAPSSFIPSLMLLQVSKPP